MAPHLDCYRVALILGQVWECMAKIVFDDAPPYAKAVPGKTRHEAGERLAKAQWQ
jgi:hypothetical protein